MEEQSWVNAIENCNRKPRIGVRDEYKDAIVRDRIVWRYGALLAAESVVCQLDSHLTSRRSWMTLEYANHDGSGRARAE